MTVATKGPGRRSANDRRGRSNDKRRGRKIHGQGRREATVVACTVIQQHEVKKRVSLLKWRHSIESGAKEKETKGMNFGAGKKGCNRLSAIGASSLLLVLIVGLCTITSLVFSSPLCDSDEAVVRQGEEAVAMAGGLMGAPKEVKSAENSAEIEDIGKFAVQEHNSKEGKNLTFKKVVTAKRQVVSGTMYHLTLEAAHASEQAKLYEAKVWTKPWESHKSLEHFKESETSSSVSSDTREPSGLRAVSVDDPVIKEAAEHALKGLNNMSNSLVPYKLKEILSAHAEAGDEETKFQLDFKVSKGTKDEDMKAGLHRTAEGKWTVTSSPQLQ